MDQVVDVLALVDPDRIAARVEQQRQGHRQVELAGVRHGPPTQPPEHRHQEHAAGIPQGPDLHRLAAVAGRLRVEQRVESESDQGRLRGRARHRPPERRTQGR